MTQPPPRPVADRASVADDGRTMTATPLLVAFAAAAAAILLPCAVIAAEPAAAARRPGRSRSSPTAASRYDAPENTLAAINLTWDRGGEAVEMDVHLTSDGKLITIHDKDTLRVTGGPRTAGRSWSSSSTPPTSCASSTSARGRPRSSRASGCR